MKKFLLTFVALGLATAYANSYTVTFFQPSMVNGTELKAGDYKVDVSGNKATIRHGKDSVQADVKIETGDKKYNATTVRYSNGDGKYRVQEIRLGGTKTKLVFN